MSPIPDSGLWMMVTHSAFPIIVDAMGKSFLLMGAMCLVVLCMKRCSAAARHLAWFLAVLSLLALPLLSLALPGWRVLPAWMSISRGTGVALHSPSAPVPTVSVPVADSGLPVTGRSTPVESASVASVAPAPIASSASAPTMKDKPGLSTSAAMLSVGSAAWMIGSALALLPALLGMISLWHLGRGARRETASSWLELLGHLLARLRIRRRVALLRSSRRPMPMTWGVVHPKLLVPEEAQEWSDERRRVVLLHELAHTRRWDYLTNLVTQLVCALYWFNPLVWLAARRMIAERERACDDIVLTQGASPADYAEQVLQIAANLRTGRFAGAMGIAMARQSTLEGRLLAILDGTRSRSALTRAAVVASLAAMIAVVAPVAMTKAAQSAPDERNGSLSGSAAITAHVLGTDGKPCNASVTFWRAVETTASAEPTVEEFWDLSSKTMRWRDTVNDKTWEPIRHIGTTPDATVGNLEPGEYRVTAEMVPGPAPFGVSDVIRVDDAKSTKTTTIRLEAGPSLTVSGIESATQQSVSGLDARAREGWFVVALTRADGLPVASWSSSRWSGPRKQDGVVRFEQLQPGKYRLIAYCPAYLYGRAECVSADGPMEIEMLPGQNRQIAVPLKRVDFSEEEVRRRWPFVAQGRVTDERGQGIEGAYVQVHCGMGTLWQTGETRSGADGRYTLRFRGGVNSETGRAARQVASIGVSKSGFVEAGRQPQGDLMMDGDPAAAASKDSHLILPDKPFELDFVMKPETKTADGNTRTAETAALSDGARLRELLVAGKWDEALKLARPAARCPESHNSSEGFIQTSSPIILDWDLCASGQEPDEELPQRPFITKYPWLEFSQKPDGLFATLHLRYQSWPKTAWKVRLQRVDRAGAMVVVHRQDEKVVENSGNIMGVPSIDESEVVFHLGDDPVFRPSPGMLYMVSIETLSTAQGNPVRWGEVMPLSLDLATPENSRVFRGESLTLTRADGNLVGKVAASILSYPRCGWRLSLDLTDDAGRSLISAGTYAENSGEIRRVSELAHMEFPITVPADAGALDAARLWTLRVERVSGAQAPGPDAHATTSTKSEVPSLNEIMEALGRRDAKYRAAKLKFVYKRSTSGTDSPEMTFDGCSLLTCDGNIREEEPWNVGNASDKTRWVVNIKNGSQRAEVRQGEKIPSTGVRPVTMLNLSHENLASNIESTLAPVFLGPHPWNRERWREMDRLGKLQIEQKEIDGIHCVILTTDGHTVALAPLFDWAPMQCVNTSYQAYGRHGDYWLPSKVRMLTLASLSQFRDDIDIERVEVLDAIPPQSFDIPLPSVGDTVCVAYAKWEPAWDSATLEPHQVRGAMNCEHRFAWKEPLEGKDALIWTISQKWRSSNQVLQSLRGDAKDASTSTDITLPFLSQDQQAIVWARYDRAAKRLKIVEAPGNGS